MPAHAPNSKTASERVYTRPRVHHAAVMKASATFSRPRSPPQPPTSSYRGSITLPTACVVCSQLTFLGLAYVHAFLRSELSASQFHISAVLDDDVRSKLCACVGAAGLASMVVLELRRELARRLLRTLLAAASGIGIVATCLLRESRYLNGHRLVAALTFASAVTLIWVIVAASRATHGLRGAIALTLLVIVTGIAQGVHIIYYDFFNISVLPSWMLGTLELGLLVGFAGCVCTCIGAGAVRLVQE